MTNVSREMKGKKKKSATEGKDYKKEKNMKLGTRGRIQMIDLCKCYLICNSDMKN